VVGLLALGLPGSALAQAPAPPYPTPPQQYFPPPSPYPPPPPQQNYPVSPYPPPPPPQAAPGYRWPPPPPPTAYPPPPAPQAQPQYSPWPYGGYQAPHKLPYRAGQPTPTGYRLVEEPRHGLVTAGYLVAGIPYGLGLLVAISADFDNGTQWLALPIVGPWLTMGLRNYRCETGAASSEARAGCIADVFVVMGLIMDGGMQAGGVALLLSGYLSKKKTLVRDDLALTLRPLVAPSAWGVSASGRF
jgi:hypothetical protein